VVGLGLLVWYYQDKWVQLFLNEANKYVESRVDVGPIKVDVVENFPQLSIVLNEVRIYEPRKDSAIVFANVGKVYLSFDFLKLWNGVYEINEIALENGRLNLKTLPNGSNNWTFWKTDTTISATKAGKSDFDLHHISLKNLELDYQNSPLGWQTNTQIKELNSSLKAKADLYQCVVKTDLLVKQMILGTGTKNSFFTQKKLAVNSQFNLDNEASTIIISDLELLVENAAFGLKGAFNYSKKASVQLILEGKNTSFQHLVSLLPQYITEPLAPYKSGGEVYFLAKANGPISSTENPDVNVSFGCKNASFTDPDSKMQLSKVNLEGVFNNQGTGNLSLANMNGVLDSKPFTGYLKLQNLKLPEVDFGFEGDLSLKGLASFLKNTPLKGASGETNVQLSYNGPAYDLQNPKTWERVKFTGEIDLNNVAIPSTKPQFALKNLVGTVLFDNKDIAVSNLKGDLGANTFAVNANLQKIIPLLLNKNKPVFIEADVTCPSLNVDAFFDAPQATGGTQKTSTTNDEQDSDWLNHIELKLNMQTKSLAFNKIRASNVVGKLLVNKNGFKVEDLKANAAGGQFQINLLMDTRKPTQWKASGNLKTDAVLVDSVFYMLDNFGQQYLTGAQIKGRLTSATEGSFSLDANKKIIGSSVVLTARAKLEEGKLLKFEPLMAMSKFFKEDKLMNLSFDKLENQFSIANSIITIPEMEVKSSLIIFSVLGTHTFDQVMDYRVKVPLKNFRKTDPDAKFGEIKANAGSDGNLILHIYGKEGNLKVVPDKQAIKEQLRKSWQDEKKEFLNLFKKDKEVVKEKATEPTKTEEGKEEFFDF
jgi:uncharacterized protein involved in outer membrane biogenesis